MKKNIMRISFVLGLTIFLCLSLISCSDEVSYRQEGLVNVSVDSSSSKSLRAGFDSYDPENYWWSYKLVKKDDGDKYGAQDAFVAWKSGNRPGDGSVYADAKGLDGCSHKLSMGKWEMTLRAYVDQSRAADMLVYEGKAEFVNKPGDTLKQIYVPIMYQDFEADSTTERLEGNIKVDVPNILINSTDAVMYELGTSSCTTKTSVYIWSYDDVTTPVVSDTDIVDVVEKTSATSGLYVLNIIYDYYIGTDKVASYVATDTFNVHGNLTATISGTLDFIRLEDFDIIYQDGDITYFNNRPTTSATDDADGGYTGDNREVLIRDYSIYQYGTGLVLSDFEADCLREGYTFGGWFTDEAVTTSQTDGATDQAIGKYDAGDKTLYAKWTPNKYILTVHYMDKNDTEYGKRNTTVTDSAATTELNAYYDDYMPEFKLISRKGYIFGGLYLNDCCDKDSLQVYSTATDTDNNLIANKGIKDKEDDTTVTDTFEDKAIFKGTKDRDLYAKWTPEVTTVTLKGNLEAYRTTMTDAPEFPVGTTTTTDAKTYTFTFDEKVPEFVSIPKVEGWTFEGYYLTSDTNASGTDLVFNGIGVISNTDFADENGAWIYDTTPTDGENCTLTLYAKWTKITPMTEITLDACGKGDDGKATVEQGATSLTSFTSVTNTSPTVTVLGYFTKPYGHADARMILTSMGDFTTDTDAIEEKETVTGNYLMDDGGTIRWNLGHPYDCTQVLKIRLYAHYLLNEDVEVGTPTNISIKYDADITIPLVIGEGTSSYENCEGEYEVTTKLDLQHTPECEYAGYGIEGLYKSYNRSTKEFTDKIANADGTLIAGTPYTNEYGQWTCDEENVNLYAKWIDLTTITDIILDACGNGKDGYAVVLPFASEIKDSDFTPVETSATVLGYFTKADGHGDGGQMILTSTGDFVITTTATEQWSGEPYFEDGKWNLVNPDDNKVPFRIRLYAHYESVTKVTLDSCGKGTNGSAEIALNATTWTSFTSVIPSESTDIVLGYYTKPDGMGGDMILTTEGNFTLSTATDSAGNAYFKDGKWNIDAKSLTLYAHYPVGTTIVLDACGLGTNGTALVETGKSVATLFTSVTNTTATVIGYYTRPQGIGEDGVLIITSSGDLVTTETETYLTSGEAFFEDGKWNLTAKNIRLYAHYTLGTEVGGGSSTEVRVLYAVDPSGNYNFDLIENCGWVEPSEPVEVSVGESMIGITPPTSKSGDIFMGLWLKTGEKIAYEDGRFLPNVTGYTDKDGKWIYEPSSGSELKLYAKWSLHM